MPIKLAPSGGFAEVPDDVIAQIKEVRARRAKQIATNINELKLDKTRMQGAPRITSGGRPPRVRDDYRIKQIDAEIKVLNTIFMILKKTSGGGSVLEGAKRGGFSDIMMRMRRLPFEKFYLKSRVSNHSGQQDWIIGLTKPIVSTIEGRHRGKTGSRVETTSYNMGKYYIAVLSQAIGTHQPAFHLMPEANPTTQQRHMHHMVDGGSSSNMSKSNPLDWIPANCYGSFGSAISGTFINADIPELFRMLYLFTAMLNPNSPLLELSQLPHVTEVSDAT